MNEFEFIKRISAGIPTSGGDLLCGIGDDAAVIKGPGDKCWLVTADILAEGSHFYREWGSWEDIGHKALAVNLSDIAAMGGIPRFYFVSASIPSDMSTNDLDELFKGMNSLAVNHAVILAGGDTTSAAKGVMISITAIGEANADNIIYRSGAKTGDAIYVSGSLGGSKAGLISLMEGYSDEKSLIQRHLRPEARVKLGEWLGSTGLIASMIDISDGLVSEADHIADESGVGYMINAEAVPVFDGVEDFAARHGLNAQELALTSGEEYELLFTVGKGDEAELLARYGKSGLKESLTRIGETVADKSRRDVLDESGQKIDLPSHGFIHNIGS